MIQIICAACRSVIGTLEGQEQIEEDADLIAIAHTESCTATEEQKEQAVYDIRFRQMTKGLGL